MSSDFSPAALKIQWADLAALASTIPDSSGSTGEQTFRRVGGASKAGISDASRLGIVSLSRVDWNTESMCGSLVGGKGKKMCVRESCTIQSHQSESSKAKEAFEFEGEGEVDEMVFLRATHVSGGILTTVFLEPKLPRAFFTEEAFMEQETRQQPVEVWEVLFKSLKGLGRAYAGPEADSD